MNQKDGQCSIVMQLLYGLENTVQVKIEIESLIEIKMLSLTQHFFPDSLFFQTYKISNGRKQLLSNLNIYLCKQNWSFFSSSDKSKPVVIYVVFLWRTKYLRKVSLFCRQVSYHLDHYKIVETHLQSDRKQGFDFLYR